MDTCDGLPATKEAVAVMEEMGYNIRNHHSQDIEDFDLSSFTLVVAMTQTIAAKLKTLGVQPERIVTLDVPDPYGKGIAVYRSTAKKIELALKSLLLLAD
jgi:protein-tyrosine-phosphatase